MIILKLLVDDALCCSGAIGNDYWNSEKLSVKIPASVLTVKYILLEENSELSYIFTL